MRVTAARRRILERGKEMEHAGGFYTNDIAEHRRCEVLRTAGLLKFWNGRHCMFWRAQFYTITDAGRSTLASLQDRGQP